MVTLSLSLSVYLYYSLCLTVCLSYITALRLFIYTHVMSYHTRSADGTCRVWGLRDAAKARDVEDGVEIPVVASVMPHAQYIGQCQCQCNCYC